MLDPQQASERDARMIAADAEPSRALPATPPPVLGDGVLQRDVDGARARDVGHLTAQHRLTHAGRTAWLDDLIGGGFALLTDGVEPVAALDDAHRAFLRRIGAHIVPLFDRDAPRTRDTSTRTAHTWPPCALTANVPR